MRSALTLALFLFFSAAFASDTGRPTGQNCGLTDPPGTAGEAIDHGTELRIYPRVPDMGSQYSGCQVRWASDKDRWDLIGIVSVVKGEPVRLWSPAVSAITCLYDKGRIVQGDVRICPDAQALVLKSRAPGCLARMSAGANPPGCEAE